MIKIAFICHGNICRSPMAKFIFLDLLEKNNLQNMFFVDSFATSDEEIYYGVGNPLYPMARNILLENNIKITNHNAKLITKNDYDRFDYFICMDNNNVRNTLRIFNQDNKKKVFLLNYFLNSNSDVSDPWYSRNFQLAFDDISNGCKALLAYLIENKKNL